MIDETITSLAPRVAAGELKAERVTEEALTTIQRLQPELNAFITVTGDEALARARAADKEIAGGRYLGPLHGMPLSLKDLVDQAGVPTTAASRVREGRIARTDAPLVSRLRAAGAVFVGKTNLHEFAFGTTNEDSGWGPACNPVDPSRSPGGSSGGSAIAVRTGMSVASVGTDTGGSVRIPAAACGVVGLKPGWGEIGADGVVPLSRQLDHVGPLARSVADAGILYHLMRGDALPDLRNTREDLAGLTFATLDAFFLERASDEVERGVRAAYETLARKGARLASTFLPHAHDIAPVYLHLVLADAAAYHATALQQRPHAYTHNVRVRLEMGRHVLGEDYARALRGREIIAHEVERALAGVDAVLLPALAVEAPPLGAETVRVKDSAEPIRNAMLRCTQPFNLSGHPAISIPCATSQAGLPIGLQIVGRRGGTPELLRVARAVEDGLSQR
jgi:aspartyl-tRNA(Asn)/glutamyl-tRNA(Gln) amidotransferase subunit A